MFISADSSACEGKKVSRSEGSREAPGNFPRQAGPGCPSPRQATPQRPRRFKIAKNGSVVLVLTRKAPNNHQIMFNSVPKPPPDASKTHPCRRIHPSDVKNRSVALLFATRNAPLSRISLSGPPKCERGARFCIPKRTPIANFASRTSKVRAWSHFCAPSVPLSQVLRLGHPKYTNTQTQIHTNTQSYKHANMQTRCEVFLDRRVRSRRHAA